MAQILLHGSVPSNFKINQPNWEEFHKGIESFYLPLNISDPRCLPVIETTFYYWNMAFAWVIKLDWDSKWIVGKNKFERDRLKARGVFLYHYWGLCKECHAMQDAISIKNKFDNAGKWFGKLWWELVGIDLEEILFPTRDIENSNIKESFLEIDRARLRALKQGENPFASNHKAIALNLLIDTALALQDSSDVFTIKHWRPFLTAYSKHIEEIKRHWGRGYIECSKYYIQTGKGKNGTKRICVENLDTNMFGRRNITGQGFQPLPEKPSKTR
jgi:hypothetical protein